MELEGGSLPDAQRLLVPDLGWSSAGSLTSGADALWHLLWCEAEGGRESLHLTFNFSGGRPCQVFSP